MLDRLPLELVVYALRVSAEVMLHDDRMTVCNIARSSSIGYSAVIPTLYRTLIVSSKKHRAVRRVFRKSSGSAGNVHHTVLVEPPLRRLCPHVRRVFYDTFASAEVAHLPALVNLEVIISLPSGNNFLAPDMFPALASWLRHFHILTMLYPPMLPNTITHASYYAHFPSTRSFEQFQEYTERVFGHALTHVALELNRPIAPELESQFTALLRLLLLREPANNIQAPVVLRLYQGAVDSQTVVLAAIAALGSVSLCSRVLIWNDHRTVEGTAGDVRTSLEDAVMGRTPWTESRSPGGS